MYGKCVADRGGIRELIKVESKQNNAILEMLVMRTFHSVVVLVNVSKLSTYKRSAPNSSTMLHPNLKYQNIITIRDLHRIQFNVVEDDIQFNVLEDRTSDANYIRFNIKTSKPILESFTQSTQRPQNS